jgi:hypothetical protein
MFHDFDLVHQPMFNIKIEKCISGTGSRLPVLCLRTTTNPDPAKLRFNFYFKCGTIEESAQNVT